MNQRIEESIFLACSSNYFLKTIANLRFRLTSFLAKSSHLLVHLSFEKTFGLTVLDESGYGHNAEMSGAILILPYKGKCSSIANFKGGKILFDPKTFHVKPRKAITVAMWVKLDHIKGSVSLFSIQRSQTGQGAKLDLRISADRIWWAHVNENRKLIFDVSMTE